MRFVVVALRFAFGDFEGDGEVRKMRGLCFEGEGDSDFGLSGEKANEARFNLPAKLGGAAETICSSSSASSFTSAIFLHALRKVASRLASRSKCA